MISEEPTVLAPGNIINHPYLKPVVGFAIAASVAVMAILGLQQQNGPENSSQPQTVAQQPQQVPNPASRQYKFPSRLASTNSQPQEYRPHMAESRINSYMVNYNEYRTTHNGMHGMLPYVRIITYENEK